MQLSVIVPVYNVEKYLPRCLDSLLRQGMGAGEYEIICVNDGSPDGSAAILADYERRYPDIICVITQKNGGVGAARNTGMLAAKGEYLAFIDSDDYVVDGAFRYLLDHFCTDDKPDVLHYQYRSVWTDGVALADPDAKPDGEVLLDGDGAEIYNKDRLVYVWTKFYRHAFLLHHHLQFEIDIAMCEDEVFNFDVFCHHPRLVTVSCNVSRYEQVNGGSAMHIMDKERVLVQLNDLHYDIHYLHLSIDSGNFPDLKPAALRTIAIFVLTFSNKFCHIPLTRGEWTRYTRLLRPADIDLLDGKKEPTRLGRIISWLKQNSLRSYKIYRLSYWLYANVFEGKVRQLILSRQ
ncbi:MAG: glycosyltransferase [Bacteroidaceae bacterium]|nr:glycosyltransferase [Bacteroidaceae bacterium]